MKDIRKIIILVISVFIGLVASGLLSFIYKSTDYTLFVLRAVLLATVLYFVIKKIDEIVYEKIQGKEIDDYIDNNQEEIEAFNKETELEELKLKHQYSLIQEEFQEEEEKFRPYYTYEDYNIGINNDCLVFFEMLKPIKYELDEVRHGKTIIKKVKSENLPGKITEIKRIPLSSILFYTKEGDVQYTTHIEDSGINVKGAVKGAIIAGGAGAIIGSRASVLSRSEEHDSRCVVIRTVNEEIRYPIGLYGCLLKLIPEKDLVYIQLGNNNETQDNKPT